MLGRTISGVTPAARWVLVGSPSDCVWKEFYLINHVEHIAGKVSNPLHHYNLVHKIYSYASSNEDAGPRPS